MKLTTKIILFCMVAVTSCEVADSDKPWGIAKVYMPQASIQSGGADNNYYVPSGDNEFDKNYSVDSLDGNNTINVVLGVYRSGLQDLEGYTVAVHAEPDTVNQLIANGTLTNAVLLPEDTYTLPETVSVPDGEREAVFYLTIDRNQLLNNYPSYSANSLVLAVSIANPTNYELNQSLSTTIVIVSDEWETLE